MNGLAENLQLFGLDGKTDYFTATYTIFADIVKSQYPKLLPAYDPVGDVVDLAYLKELQAAGSPRAHRRTLSTVVSAMARRAGSVK